MGHKHTLYFLKQFDGIQWLIMSGNPDDKKTWKMIAQIIIDDPDSQIQANLIITAVNVMPEVKRVLKRTIEHGIEPETKRCRVCGWKEHDDICYVKHAEKLLLELKGVS